VGGFYIELFDEFLPKYFRFSPMGLATCVPISEIELAAKDF